MIDIILQFIVGGCFIALIIVLFFEKTDYITYSIFLMVVAAIATAILRPEINCNIISIMIF
jgi:hypothetical protein